MRILHVVPTYYPAVRYGGPIFAVHGLCRALAARGHELHVFTTNVDGPGTTATPVAKPVDLDGVQIRYFPCPLVRRLYWSPALGEALRHQIGNFDLVHLHSVFLSLADMGRRPCGKEHRHSLRAIAERDAG